MIFVLQVPKVDLPKADWVEEFFDTTTHPDRFRGHFARRKGWDLRVTPLPKGDEEIRLWSGGWHSISWVLMLRKTGGTWTAERLFWGGGDEYDPDWTIPYAAPVSGWPTFWRTADELGLRTLPDDSRLPQKLRVEVDDGMQVVVEVQAKGTYRAYRYDNPQWQVAWPEARRMTRLFELTEKEFPD